MSFVVGGVNHKPVERSPLAASAAAIVLFATGRPKRTKRFYVVLCRPYSIGTLIQRSPLRVTKSDYDGADKLMGPELKCQGAPPLK